MFNSYRESVEAVADDDGLLTPADARKLVRDHQCEWSEWVKECPMGTNPRDAHHILCWLGH